ncbi:hypothetical protein DXG01_006549, partial [Tephrocybe rancida]
DRDTQDVLLEKPGEEPLSFHPLHAEKIYKYHVDARRTNGRSKLPVPRGYHTLSHTFNYIPEGRFKGRMCELNQATSKWTIPANQLSSKVICTNFVDEKRYHDLILINLITHRGQVNTRVFDQIMVAWRASAEEAVKKDNYYQNLCDEREDALVSASEDKYNSGSDNSEEEPLRIAQATLSR